MRASVSCDATGLLTLGRIYFQAGSFVEAKKVARRILSDPSISEDERIGAMLLSADCLRSQGKLQEALAVRRQVPEPATRARRSELQHLDARILAEQGCYEECIKKFDPLRRARAETKEDILIQTVVAQCHARAKSLSEARRSYEWVVAESEQVSWPEGAADGLMGLSLLDRIEGHWARGEALLLRAREIYAQAGYGRKYIAATLNLGVQRLWRGHLSFADEAFREAIRLACETGDGPLEATGRMDRGLTLVRLNRIPEARAELARALRLCRRQTSPRRHAIALEYTGELALAERNYNRAISALRRAESIAARIAPEGDIIPEVRRRQAEAFIGRGDHEQALETSLDAEERARKLGDRYERATTLRVQGEALLALGRPTEAHDRLIEGLQILEALGETFELDRVSRVLALIDQDRTSGGEETRPTAGGAQSRARRPGRRSALRSEMIALLHRQGIIGQSSALVDLMQEVVLIAPLEIPVLIQGETGTGKELLAHALHRLGQNPRGPFIALNCATCPPDLLDAELFGFVRGAFTGAGSGRLGLVRSAEGGTLFLDEIGEMREESQARLLRFLDSGEVRPLGCDQAQSVRTRIVAATHADLEDRIRTRRFRRDLYFRLGGIRLSLPPLRERSGDVRVLVEHFLKEVRRSIRPMFAGFSESALRRMERYAWPGNIRQLRLEVHRCAALAEDGVAVESWGPAHGDEQESAVLDPVEAAAILADPARLRSLLKERGRQMVDVARILGISRGHLYRVLKRFDISPGELRAEP